MCAHGNIVPGKIRINVGAHKVAVAGKGGRAFHGLISCVQVKILKPLAPCINNYRYGGVALHSECFTAIKFPFGEPAPFLAHVNHGAYHVNLPFGICEGHELMHIAVCVPEREYCVALMSFGNGKIFKSFHLRVLAVDICQNVGVDERVI